MRCVMAVRPRGLDTLLAFADTYPPIATWTISFDGRSLGTITIRRRAFRDHLYQPVPRDEPPSNVSARAGAGFAAVKSGGMGAGATAMGRVLRGSLPGRIIRRLNQAVLKAILRRPGAPLDCAGSEVLAGARCARRLRPRPRRF
jgi:hypothetical protein